MINIASRPLIHEVNIDAFLAKVLDETGEVGKRPPKPVEFVGGHHIVLSDVLAEGGVFGPVGVEPGASFALVVDCE